MKNLALIFVVFLSGCSGGDGVSALVPAPPPSGSPPPSETPPVTSNTPPSLSLNVSETTIDELQSFIVDTTRSSDADGDALTFEIDLGELEASEDLLSNTPARWEIYTDEVDENHTYTLTVTASDGKESTSEEVQITVENYNRRPLNTTWGDVSETADVSVDQFDSLDVSLVPSARFVDNISESGYRTAHMIRPRLDGKVEILEFEMTNGFGSPRTIVLDTPPIDDAIVTTAKIQTGSLPRSFAVQSNAHEKVWIFRRDGNNEANLSGDLELSGLCSASWDYPDISSSGASVQSLLAGTEDGLWIFINEGAFDRASAEIGSFRETRIYNGQVSGNFCFAGPYSTFYDADRNEFIALDNDAFGAPNFPAVTPVNVPDGLELVTIKAGKLKYDIKFFALLFAGPEHTSEHRLIILHETPSGLIEQIDYPLPHGIPSQLVVESIDTNFDDLIYGRGEGNRDTDIVIAVPETPYIYIITVETDDQGGVTFSPIEYAYVDFFVQDIAIKVTDGTERYSLITNDGETLSLRKSTLDFSRP